MYGNYCGPYWSNGAFQSSVNPTVDPMDELDAICMEHDRIYFLRGDLLAADREFVGSAYGNSWLGALFAIPVGLQYMVRATDKLLTYQNTTQTMVKVIPPKMKNTPTVSKKEQKLKKNKVPPGMSTTVSTPPVSYGTMIKATNPIITRTLTDARVVGRDFIGTVEGQGVSTFGLGKSALLSPAFFLSTILGNMARSFEKYKWNRLRIHYVPKVATSVTGQVILCSQSSCTMPGLQPEAGTFLPRAMSQGNASFGPLWAANFIDITCDTLFRNIDPTTSVDLDDSILAELQVYTQVNAVQQVGYLFAEYDIAFKEPVYSQHSLTVPIPTGPGLRVILGESGLGVVNADFALIDPHGTLGLASSRNGTIWRLVFDIQGSTPSTGATLANCATVATTSRATTATFQTQLSDLPFIGGLTLYGVTVNTEIDLYTSMEAALNGNGTGQVFYRTVTTVANGAYNFDAQMVRIGTATMAVIQ